ncbi:MAG TPA: 4-(cytidine 5'-diphospho)-2-C-methyl-D-erythritol kinase [Candidatus Dormibacteraeota bacterium]|jgi:4-diphosphocytidyl-2-C-methyl-D-erythritol kinase|nr:4-(cytidine 5'-diphospho)-2-C-methyl-D-erythritol kinase [Candidatus Dormibacteraeota bacterium]
MTLVLKAPAKLNLGLEVVGRRPDGYHELCSIMVSISLADSVELSPGEGLTLGGPHAEGVPHGPSVNLAGRALAELETIAGRSLGQALSLTKNVPAGAGLGGGSADAGAVLRAAARLGVDADRDRLLEAAVALGADVPFQSMGGTALVRGLGERITPLQHVDIWFAVAYPGVPVSTADVFAELSEEEWSDGEIVAAAARQLEQGPLEIGDLTVLPNALWGPATRRFPMLAQAVGRLRGAGWRPRLTGSGSAMYHASEDEAEARSLTAAAAGLGFAAWSCHTLPAHEW